MRLVEHDDVRAGAGAAGLELLREVVRGREAVDAGADDDVAGRGWNHGVLPPGQRCVKIALKPTMARTGSPATRHVAAVERAVAVLDILAEAGELGTNEVARRTGSTRAPLPASSRRSPPRGSSSTWPRRAATGSGRGWWSSATQCSLGSTCGSSHSRTCGRSSHETGETATLSVPGEPDAITIDFVQSASSVQSVARARAAERRARDRDGQGRARLRRRRAAARAACGRTPPGRSPTASVLARRDRRRAASAATREALGEREDDLNAIAAPVLGARGELVAVIGVQGPAARFAGATLTRAQAPLLACAADVSQALGGLAPASPPPAGGNGAPVGSTSQ